MDESEIQKHSRFLSRFALKIFFADGEFRERKKTARQ